MTARHFIGALLLAFGIGQHAVAQDQPKPDAAQETQQAAEPATPQGAQADAPKAAQSRKAKAKASAKAKEQAAASEEKQSATAPALLVATAATAAGTMAPETAAAAAAPAEPATAETLSGASSDTSATPASATPETPPPVAPASASDTRNSSADPLPSVAERDWLDAFLYDVKITDVLVALFAGLLVLLASLQVRRTRDAVRVAAESAAVAEKSARVAEDALISGQRAFMFIREIKTFLHQDAETGKYHWTIHPIWANSGNTPTRSLSINTSFRLLDAPLPEGYDFPHSGEAQVPSIAGPRSMVEAASGTISSEDLQAVQEGRKYFYIWGWAEYHDIFEGTRKRITRFCNQLVEVDGDTSAPLNEQRPIQMMFGFHGENNYAD